MRESDYQYFILLKAAIEATFREAHPHSTKKLIEFKGQDIVDFQEDLASKTNGRISEKWFYTHIKGETGKLPRIDILNMLSQYVGHSNWEAFVTEQAVSKESEKVPSTNRKWSWAVAAIVLAMIGISLVFPVTKANDYIFCFVDADDNTPIKQDIDIVILKNGESPQVFSADENGCFKLNQKEKQVTLVVRTAYYQHDTIQRNLRSQNEPEEIRLKKDDYALMIHYFSTANLDDWKKRRDQLSEMIADHARIFQVFGKQQSGMEMYNKDEFINKMTMPLKSLRNIEIIETVYEGDQIVAMRFMQKD